MSDEFTITLPQVKVSAESIRLQNKKLNACLQDISKTMNQLSVHWQSPAATTLQSKFQRLLPTFDSYYETIESYAMFLEQTVETYQMLEKELQKSSDTLTYGS